ncbi:nucleotidyl transferase AbiEii/AbiGii toxin family protein [Patescibacteria group bacterium]
MFTKEEIEKKAIEFKLDPSDVERDYIQSWIINEVSKNNFLGQKLTLKGSCALRKLYFPFTRFAKDIDFSADTHIDENILKEQLLIIGKEVQKHTGVIFTEKVNVRDKNLPKDTKVDALEARLYFKGIYTDGKFDLKTQVDVTQNDKFYLPSETRPIIHPYSDSEKFINSKIVSQKVEDIIATKFITLIHRQKPGDFFDLVQCTFIKNELKINRSDIIKALLSRTDFGERLEETRNYFFNLPIKEKYCDAWGGILVPAQNSISFDDAHGLFLSSIGDFFDEMALHISTVIDGSIGIGKNLFREQIISAGKQKRLVELTYSDKVRKIEPYKLEYYTREDGQAFEYFWGFDQTGGTSGANSIKMFFVDKIQNANKTMESFSPRWDVEF